MPRELLQRRKGDRRKQMHASNVVESNNKHLCMYYQCLDVTRANSLAHTFLGQEINATDRLLDLQTFFTLARCHVPEADGFVVTPADEPFAAQQKGGAKVGVAL
jgi:hypothetical protein